MLREGDGSEGVGVGKGKVCGCFGIVESCVGGFCPGRVGSDEDHVDGEEMVWEVEFVFGVFDVVLGGGHCCWFFVSASFSSSVSGDQ